jgi:tetratricopeptide (TPR) repeat protein
MLADRPDDIPLSLAVNRATLSLDQGDPGGALELLKNATEQHPGEGGDKTRLLVLEARFRLGETEAVRTVLDKLADEGKESTLGLEAELLKGRLFPEWSSVPRLWSLLHRHPDFSPLAERLTWLLLVSQDYPAAHRVLDLYEVALHKSGQEPPWWDRMVRALLLAAEDRLADASDAFATVPAAWRDATYFADWSLTSLVRAQQADPDHRLPLLDDALEKLTRALDLLPPGADPASLQRRSRWLTRRGELQTSLLPLTNPGQRGALRSAAAEDFRQAVQLDPDNFRASFLLRQSLTTKQETP